MSQLNVKRNYSDLGVKAIQFFRKENISRIDIGQKKMKTWISKMKSSTLLQKNFESNLNVKKKNVAIIVEPLSESSLCVTEDDSLSSLRSLDLTKKKSIATSSEILFKSDTTKKGN